MLILWKENLVIFAVPKTGTTAIEQALAPHAAISFLRPPAAKHMTHQRFNRFMRPWLKKEGKEDIRTVALMREPISWLGSWYRYRQRPEVAGSANSTAGLDFDAFVRAYLGENPRPAYARLGSQARQLSKSRTEVGIDHLFRFEEMGRFVEFIEARVGVRLELPRINVSPAMPLTLSPALEKRLRQQHALDFDLYARIKA